MNQIDPIDPVSNSNAPKQFTIFTSPHSQQTNGINWIMGQVIIALIPGIIAMLYLFGWGVLINIVIATIGAVAAESLALYLRNKPIAATLKDLSAVVTAILLALALPSTLPWWLTLLGIAFAIIVAKHLYGGLGYNPFNPAMVGYAFLLISYPRAMTIWLPPYMLSPHPLDLLETLRLIFLEELPTGLSIDAISAATPLEMMRTGLSMNIMISEIRCNPVWGDFGGRGWEWLGNWYAIGGIWLIYRKVINWQIPFAVLGSITLISGFLYMLDSQCHPFPAFHLFSGGTMLGAFFIATDPVTAATTPKGQLIYGAAIGLLVFTIRTWGGYPDAVAFAVLLINMAVPMIDQYTQPRVFGSQI